MAAHSTHETSGGNNEAAGGGNTWPLQLLRNKREFPRHTELLVLSQILHLPYVESPRSKGKVEVSEVSANLEILHSRSAPDSGYLELVTKDFLKSRMRENRTYGSVRGSDIPFRFLNNERSVELSTRHLRLLDITATTFSDFCLTKACQPMLSIRCTPTFSEKV